MYKKVKFVHKNNEICYSIARKTCSSIDIDNVYIESKGKWLWCYDCAL